MLIPPELRVKGGPRRYEAIFVGYDENRVGWYVRDLKGTCHFSRDVIFNESVPGHLSPPRRSVPSSPSVSIAPSRPVRSRTRTAGGQAFADLIHTRDTALASRRSRLIVDAHSPDGGASFLSLSHILDFVSLVNYHSFSDPSHTSSLDSVLFPFFLSLDFPSFAFISTDPSRFLRAPSSFSPADLLKPPESYHEACSRPDASVWRAAMDREVDSLHARNAFEPASLPRGRKAIGVRWVFAFKYHPDGSILRGKERLDSWHRVSASVQKISMKHTHRLPG